MYTPSIREIKTELNSLDIFKRFSKDRYATILESQRDREKLGRYSFIVSEPFIVLKAKKEIVSIKKGGSEEEVVGKAFDILGKLLEEYKVENNSELPFVGGAVGYLGYELCHQVEDLPNTVIDDVGIPDMYMGYYDKLVVVDHLLEKTYLVALGIEKNKEEQLDDLELKVKSGYIKRNSKLPKDVVFNCNMSKKRYLNSIDAVRNYIASGDIYQINFTQRFDCNLNKTPLELYERLRTTNPAPFASYINFGEGEIVSCSPERFIKIKDDVIETRPIKGTIARGATPEEDAINKKILVESEKDRSELLMIVDLERNDLGRISKIGSVEVTELFHIEEYATVFQQVSTVIGKVKENTSLEEILDATFPGGSITGAPKIRAMEVIDELEPTSRNIYTGSIGYIGFDGSLDLNIVIRTVVCKEDRAYFQVGGGIVWDSSPEGEYEESVLKGKALKEALSY